MQDFGVSPFQKRSWGGDPPNFGVPPPYLLLIGPLESVTQTAQAGTQLLLRTRGSPREVTVGDSSPPAAPTLGGSLVVPILRRVKLTCGEVGGRSGCTPSFSSKQQAAQRCLCCLHQDMGVGGARQQESPEQFPALFGRGGQRRRGCHRQLPTPPPRGPPKHEWGGEGGHAQTCCLPKQDLAANWPWVGYGSPPASPRVWGTPPPPPPRYSPWAAPGVPRVPQR